MQKTHAFDCETGQIALAGRISVGLTIIVHNAPRVQVGQASRGATQLNGDW